VISASSVVGSTPMAMSFSDNTLALSSHLTEDELETNTGGIMDMK
jgi:hypothetical protein